MNIQRTSTHRTEAKMNLLLGIIGGFLIAASAAFHLIHLLSDTARADSMREEKKRVCAACARKCEQPADCRVVEMFFDLEPRSPARWASFITLVVGTVCLFAVLSE